MKPGKGGREPRQDPFRDEQPEGYHYSRGERLSRPGAPQFRQRGGGIFRRNRTLLIILLDLVIVMILGLFLVRFLYARVNRAELEGYGAMLRGVLMEEVVLATVAITNKEAVSGARPEVFVRFSLVRNPGEGEAIFVSGQAPPERGGERILRATVPIPGGEPPPEVLYAEIRIDDARERMSAGLEP
jgi:hypothetical protein